MAATREAGEEEEEAEAGRVAEADKLASVRVESLLLMNLLAEAAAGWSWTRLQSLDTVDI